MTRGSCHDCAICISGHVTTESGRQSRRAQHARTVKRRLICLTVVDAGQLEEERIANAAARAEREG